MRLVLSGQGCGLACGLAFGLACVWGLPLRCSTTLKEERLMGARLPCTLQRSAARVL